MKYESVVFFKILLTAIFDIFYKKQRGVCIYNDMHNHMHR